MKRVIGGGFAGVLVFFCALTPTVAAEDSMLKSMLKSAPTAPAAWCQRHAVNSTVAWWRAGRDGAAMALPADDADGASRRACNSLYGQQLIACVDAAAPAAAPGASAATQDARAAETGLSAHIRECMARLAKDGVKPAL